MADWFVTCSCGWTREASFRWATMWLEGAIGNSYAEPGNPTEQMTASWIGKHLSW
jgi:hypothetical protein